MQIQELSDKAMLEEIEERLAKTRLERNRLKRNWLRWRAFQSAHWSNRIRRLSTQLSAFIRTSRALEPRFEAFIPSPLSSQWNR